jgi:hypothetical protein
MRWRAVLRIRERRGENRSKDGENEGEREEGGEQCGGCMGDWMGEKGIHTVDTRSGRERERRRKQWKRYGEKRGEEWWREMELKRSWTSGRRFKKGKIFSRQKFHYQGCKHNPAVDTGTFFPSTNGVFYIPSARKVTTGKSRSLNTDTTGKSWYSGPWKETFYIPPCRKSYGRKIPASVNRYGRKSRPVTAYPAEKSC